MSPQAVTEFYAWCVLILVGGLALVFLGFGGLCCFAAGVIVSQVDIGWIADQLETERGDHATSSGWHHIAPPGELPENVIPLRRAQNG